MFFETDVPITGKQKTRFELENNFLYVGDKNGQILMYSLESPDTNPGLTLNLLIISTNLSCDR